MKLGKYFFLCYFSLIVCNAFTQNWDVNLLNNINPQQPNSSFQKNITYSVYPLAVGVPIIILAEGIINKNKANTNNGLYVAGSLIINTAITQSLKYTVKRQRPYNAFPNLIFPSHVETDSSFPSGHTSTAFAVATSLSITYKKWYIVLPAFAWASMVGYSRMYLGVHYPTDVFAGAIIGIGSAYLSHLINKKVINRKVEKLKVIN